MNRLIFMTILLIILDSKSSQSQFENTDIGARTSGLNGAFTSLSNNSLAVFYNPSGLGQLRYREVSVHYSPSTYGLTELKSAGLSFCEPMKFGTIGFGVRTFGFELYRETNALLSFGRGFGDKIFCGISANFYNLSIRNYGSAFALGFDFGAIAYMLPVLRWGFFAKNVSGSKIGISEQRITQTYKTGFTIQPMSDLMLIVEAEKDIRYKLSVKSGIEYSINDFADFRAAAGNDPATFTFGVSLHYEIFSMDFSLSNVQRLGFTSSGTLALNFGGKPARKFYKEQLAGSFE